MVPRENTDWQREYIQAIKEGLDSLNESLTEEIKRNVVFRDRTQIDIRALKKKASWRGFMGAVVALVPYVAHELYKVFHVIQK